MSKRSLICGLALAIALAARADDVEDLVDILRTSLGSAHPMIAFYTDLVELDDFDLDQDDVLEVLDGAGAPTDGPVGETLVSIARLEKDGDALRVERDEALTVRMDEGYVRLSTEVTCTVVVEASGDVLIDDVRGVSLGQSRFMLFPLRSVLYTNSNGKPIARLRVGYFPWITSLTMDIEPGASAGLAGSVPAN